MAMTLPNEEHFLRSLRDNEPNSFTTLYNAYAPALYGILLRMVNDRELAADLLQDAFLKIWSKRQDYDPGQGRLFTWLLTITRNTAIDELRLQKSRAKASSYRYDRLEKTELPSEVASRATASVVDQLEAKYRVVVEMHCQDEYSLPEVADRLKLPLGTVKTRYRKALQLLKSYFSQDIYHYQLR